MSCRSYAAGHETAPCAPPSSIKRAPAATPSCSCVWRPKSSQPGPSPSRACFARPSSTLSTWRGRKSGIPASKCPTSARPSSSRSTSPCPPSATWCRRSATRIASTCHIATPSSPTFCRTAWEATRAPPLSARCRPAQTASRRPSPLSSLLTGPNVSWSVSRSTKWWMTRSCSLTPRRRSPASSVCSRPRIPSIPKRCGQILTHSNKKIRPSERG
mmetsp:Transcript_4949/g.15725  ORF Transcript_4949/g.15725 Transcript_4949/m.15725 type:complete len:215 (-) Transcript_4949:1396-2040(-)